MNVRQAVVKSFQDGLFAQLVCYAAGIMVMVLGIRKLPEIATSERDIFFGVLLVMTPALLMILIGMVLQVYFWQQKHQNARSDDLA